MILYRYLTGKNTSTILNTSLELYMNGLRTLHANCRDILTRFVPVPPASATYSRKVVLPAR